MDGSRRRVIARELTVERGWGEQLVRLATRGRAQGGESHARKKECCRRFLVATIALAVQPAFADQCYLGYSGFECSCWDRKHEGSGVYSAFCITVEGEMVVYCFSTVSIEGPWSCFEEGEFDRWESQNADCSCAVSGMDPGTGGGFAKGISAAGYYSTSGGSCSTKWTRPPGYLALRMEAYKWNGHQWIFFYDTNWLYNGPAAWAMQTVKNWYSTPPQGSGYYGVYTAAYEYVNSWRGGWTWSRDIYLSSPNDIEVGDMLPPLAPPSAPTSLTSGLPTTPVAPVNQVIPPDLQVTYLS